MRDWARRHNIKDFFDIGRNGVCHALFPEKGFIRPGNTVIMGDSHTCTHGAFGAFAAGVGTTDLEVGILKGVCAFRAPKSLKIEVTGTLPKGVVAKDIILNIIKQLTVNGGTDHGDRILWTGGRCDEHVFADDALQHGGRGRGHLRRLPAGSGHRPVPLALYQG